MVAPAVIVQSETDLCCSKSGDSGRGDGDFFCKKTDTLCIVNNGDESGCARMSRAECKSLSEGGSVREAGINYNEPLTRWFANVSAVSDYQWNACPAKCSSDAALLKGGDN